MEFKEVVRRRRMVHRFLPDPVPGESRRRILEAAFRAPSAGFSQGLDLVALDDPGRLDWFWRVTSPPGEEPPAGDRPPLLVIPLSNKAAYLERYSRPDKAAFGLGQDESRWPVPYWHLDAAMSVMLMLLAAVDEGLGAWYFGISHGEAELLDGLCIPDGRSPIGVVAFGFKHPEDRPAGSATVIPRRPFREAVHTNGW